MSRYVRRGTARPTARHNTARYPTHEYIPANTTARCGEGVARRSATWHGATPWQADLRPRAGGMCRGDPACQPAKQKQGNGRSHLTDALRRGFDALRSGGKAAHRETTHRERVSGAIQPAAACSLMSQRTRGSRGRVRRCSRAARGCGGRLIAEPVPGRREWRVKSAQASRGQRKAGRDGMG